MKLDQCREAYRDFSGKASDHGRTLSLWGLAIVWLLRTEADQGFTIPRALFFPAFFLVSSLALDLLHYVSGAVAWGSFARYKELKKIKSDSDFKAPRWLNWPTNTAFALKLLAVGIGYILLLIYIANHFS